MYDIKIVKKAVKNTEGEEVEPERSQTHACPHYTSTTVRADSIPARLGRPVGVTLELGSFGPNEPIRIFHLPTDGDSAYVMVRPGGNTIERFYWPHAART